MNEQDQRNEKVLRLDCLRSAVAFASLLDAGPVTGPKVRDPVALAKEMYAFVGGEDKCPA